MSTANKARKMLFYLKLTVKFVKELRNVQYEAILQQLRLFSLTH